MSDTFMADLGLESSPASLVLARRAAMFMIGIVFLSFASRNLIPSNERRIICSTLSIMLFGLACMSIYEFLQGNINASIIPAIVIEISLWLSFGVMAMSKEKQLSVENN